MMEDDDLEYDITFPSPISVDPDENDESDRPISLDRKEPVVILLGWLGCKEKHIAKYGQIYDERGCITIRYTAPKNVCFFNPSKLKEIACKILDLLDDYSVQENPIFFHVFSNNGSYVYNHIVQVLTEGKIKKYEKLQVCGVILDSTPGKARWSRGARAYASVLNVNMFLKYLVTIWMIVYLMFTHLKAWFRTWYDTDFKKHNEHFLYENMANDPSRWPMLFIYSRADKIINYLDIEELMQHRQKLGVAVQGVGFADTDHVAHLLKHPGEYVQLCSDFLEYCLNGEVAERAEGQDRATEEDFPTDTDYLLAKRQ